MDGDASERAVVTIVNSRGLHARAAAKFVKTAQKYDAKIEVTKDGASVCGTSILGLMMLGAAEGSSLRLSANGRDAKAAIDALVQLVGGGFDEL